MEAGWFKSSGDRGMLGELKIMFCLRFCWRNVTDGSEKGLVVEPVHPSQRRKFERSFGLPRVPAMNQFSLVKTINGFRQGIVITVAATAD